jgi:TPR repeat protein
VRSAVVSAAYSGRTSDKFAGAQRDAILALGGERHAFMSRHRRTFAALVTIFAIAMALASTAFAQAIAEAEGYHEQRAGAALQLAADYGIDIVRIPPPPEKSQPSTTPSVQRPSPPPTSAPLQPQARLLNLPLKVGGQPNGGKNGWLGVEMESLELPLALSLGLADANGALILSVTVGGPAAQAGVHLGDVVVGFNGTAVANINDLRQRIASIAPGTEVDLEVRRVAGDDNDFVRLLQRLADDGDAHVMFDLGKIYASGLGGVRNEVEAVRWYRKGADAGNADAMAALAFALIDGRGTAIDQQEGLRLLKAAAAKEHVGAMNRLAHILIDGKLSSKNPVEAARLLTKAAEAGHLPSMVELGLMYSNGAGIQADASRGAMWYKQAAELGYSPGMVNLGFAYEHGTGVEADFTKAAMWYKRAVDLGNTTGMLDLGLLYAQGKGVERNEATAVALYRRAANAGNALAMTSLAWMLQSGKGVDRKDPEQAAALMLRAMDKGNEFVHQRMLKYSSAWSREFRQALQRRLRDAGFYSGPIDGEFRDSTIASLNAYINRAH